MVAKRSDIDPVALERAVLTLQHLARDHARNPVSWDGKKPNAGFSTADKTWMKTHPLSGEINVASQLGDEQSVLAFGRKC